MSKIENDAYRPRALPVLSGADELILVGFPRRVSLQCARNDTPVTLTERGSPNMTDNELRAELMMARLDNRSWRASLCQRALDLGGPLPDTCSPQMARNLLGQRWLEGPELTPEELAKIDAAIAEGIASGDPDWQAKVWSEIDGR